MNMTQWDLFYLFLSLFIIYYFFNAVFHFVKEGGVS